MINKGYQDAGTLRQRIRDLQQWLKNPRLLTADQDARYEAIIEINLENITEPLLACPNDPDDVRPLSKIQKTPVDEVFIGSCMTNIGHFRAAGKVWEGEKPLPAMRTTICPPSRMDQQQLRQEGYFARFNRVNARIEIPGCSLCMGNQLRVLQNATVFSTSTRNFDNRMGDGAQVYLGSAELGAVVAIKGYLPTPEEYFRIYRERVEPHQEEIFRYLRPTKA
jgi:aconitate hydratase 2/2-methylisocitrate dehydratase